MSRDPVEKGHADIDGVAEDLRTLFSQRDAQIEAKLAELISAWVDEHDGAEPDPWTISRLERAAVLASRPGKQGVVEADVLRAEWTSRAREAGFEVLSLPDGQGRLPGMLREPCTPRPFPRRRPPSGRPWRSRLMSVAAIGSIRACSDNGTRVVQGVPGHHVHLRAATRRDYERQLRVHILPALGDRPISHIEQVDVHRFIADLLATGMAPKTLQKVRLVLRQVFETARGSGAISSNPCDGIRIPRFRAKEPIFLSPEQVERLAQSTRPPYDLLVRFAAATGLRPSEICGLRVRRLNLLKRTVEVAEALTVVGGRVEEGPPKSGSCRTVQLTPSLCEELGAHLAKRARMGGTLHGDEYVFTAPEGGPLRRDLLHKRIFRPAVLAAGLPDANPVGPPALGWAAVEAATDRAVSQLHDGEPVQFERVSSYVTQDLGYVIWIERTRLKMGDEEEVRPVALRVTTIFRREDDGWRVVHRHADPITTPRLIESMAR